MHAIEILMNEHQLILKVIDTTPFFLQKFKKNPEKSKKDMTELISFFSEYADFFHHKKEEDILFLWMENKGIPKDSGPIACMLSEHEFGRILVQTAKNELEKDMSNATSCDLIIQSLEQFCMHLKSHIFKEDNVLYPLAEQISEETSDKELLHEYSLKFSNVQNDKIKNKFISWVEVFSKNNCVP